uniref:Histone deacetylase complex subunit SAP30 Sin3 binding domain-containing protein n=1 Tax=Brassica campestris TaxID=3711 RepID=A0A3P5YFT8_BRACM|nr:unnamed protein product [Brassica rapa]
MLAQQHFYQWNLSNIELKPFKRDLFKGGKNETRVLTNGIEVKLQRNALSVLEAPTGNEVDDDLDFENTLRNGSDMTSEDTLKPHKSKLRGQRSSRSFHKTLSRSLSSDSQSKSSAFTLPQNMVDAIPNPSKEQLIDIVQRHFMSQQMDELQVIMGFVQAARE